PESQVPTLGVWSDQDEYLVEEFVAGSERWMRADWQYERLAGASHWMMLDQPARVAGLVLDWLGR
ncbi:MAG TPA: alpha/beta hydrolase, partial [Polyangiaceae bacterium]|nr:alpha/beta hydrolase [Polyangiaceae bacterium]